MKSPIKILLVDDDPDDCYLFNDAIPGPQGSYELTCVNSFVEALSYLNTHKPALIFLDLNMPFKNGFECLKELKEDLRLKAIPVIIFSSSAYKKDIQKAYEYGAAFYLTKPSAFNLLAEALAEILSKNWEAADTITASHFIGNRYTSFVVNY